MSQIKKFTAATKLNLSPFFNRISKLNESQSWSSWCGYLSASNYALNHQNEYFTIRTKTAVIDISPLKKYIINGHDSKKFLNYICTRNINACKIGQVMYSPWCDEKGKIIDDGTIQHLSSNTFRLTSAESNYQWLIDNSDNMDIEIIDDSESTSCLAIQGPHSKQVLSKVLKDDINDLKFFRLFNTHINNIPIMISRTGYTGDLGFELWMKAEDSLSIWDVLMEKGADFGIAPVGLLALDIARIEAGFVLLDVDYVSSLHTSINARKSSPYELGLGWTVKMNTSNFIGKEALKYELTHGSSWKFCGIEVDWESLEQYYRKLGVAPVLPTAAWRGSNPLYKNNIQIGYATSGCWSPILKKYIALSHIKSEHIKENSFIEFEINVEHYRKLCPAKIVNLPFLNVERKIL